MDQQFLERVITSIPKAGTNYMEDLLDALAIDVSISHYILDTPKTRAWWGKIWPWMIRKPSDFVGKTVLLIRDLKDVMPSAVFWVEQNAKSLLQNADQYDSNAIKKAEEFLQSSFEEKLYKVIKCEDMAEGLMTLAKHSCFLIHHLLKRKTSDVWVLRFEDFIGIESGGSLDDSSRFQLLSQVFLFLGYQKNTEEIETAVRNTFGKSISYNPVIKKVGRWKEVFNENHIQAFVENWDSLNLDFGYDSILDEVDS
jgi:hypothetical protein